MGSCRKFNRYLLSAAFCSLTFLRAPAATAEVNYSTTLQGPLGLNTIPSARMDAHGTIRVGASALDPYTHGFIGIQVAEPLALVLRQTAEGSSLRGQADRLYPGLDLKVRLLKEGPHSPEVALGVQAALGHKRMAGEYLTLSKRFASFDFTLGAGWGRYGTARHIPNPLRILGRHFSQNRALDGEMTNEPKDWFTDDKIGMFGGVEYFLPWNGLSLKFDYGADRYRAGRNEFDYNAPSPFGLSLNYQPLDGVSASIGAQGTDRIMGRVSLQTGLERWTFPSRYFDEASSLPADREPKLNLSDVLQEGNRAFATLKLLEDYPAPKQIGRAVRNMGRHAGPDVEAFELTPEILHLRGPVIRLLRADFERTLGQGQGSPEEIWQNAAFVERGWDLNPLQERKLKFLPSGIEMMRFVLENQISLAEEDHGVLNRNSVLFDLRTAFFGLLTSGVTARLNIADNLDGLAETRQSLSLPVRSDLDLFTQERVSLDRLYLGFNHSLRSDLHVALTAGYLEEQYAGYGGEILYRPFDSRLAVGAELWQVYKRDAYTALHQGLTGDSIVTGHVNLWYDLPGDDWTLHARTGRYLAGDAGVTLGLDKVFDSGAALSGFVTVTNESEADPYGGTMQAYHGVRLTLPIGSVLRSFPGSEVRVRAAPFARDMGQALDKPVNLHALTEAFTLRHLARYWREVVE